MGTQSKRILEVLNKLKRIRNGSSETLTYTELNIAIASVSTIFKVAQENEDD